MIDPTSEPTFPLRHIGRHTPLRHHVATYFRWASPGIRGVCLETVKVGRQTHTSKSALLLFFTALTRHRDGPRHRPQPDEARDADVARELARRFGL